MSWGSGLVALLAILPLSSPVVADWLVLHDGSRVETTGPWRESGRLLVFTSTAGTLSALRGELVDLEASRRASAPAEAPVEAPIVRRGPILVLTDEDVSRVYLDAEEEAADAATPPPPVVDGATKIAVLGWDQRYSSEPMQLEIFGSLRNDSGTVLAGIALGVTVLDENGAPVGESTARIADQGLVVGQTTTFVAGFPELGRAEQVRFTAQGYSLAIDEQAARRAAAAQPPAEPFDEPTEEPPAESFP